MCNLALNSSQFWLEYRNSISVSILFMQSRLLRGFHYKVYSRCTDISRTYKHFVAWSRIEKNSIWRRLCLRLKTKSRKCVLRNTKQNVYSYITGHRINHGPFSWLRFFYPPNWNALCPNAKIAEEGTAMMCCYCFRGCTAINNEFYSALVCLKDLFFILV